MKNPILRPSALILFALALVSLHLAFLELGHLRLDIDQTHYVDSFWPGLVLGTLFFLGGLYRMWRPSRDSQARPAKLNRRPAANQSDFGSQDWIEVALQNPEVLGEMCRRDRSFRHRVQQAYLKRA